MRNYFSVLAAAMCFSAMSVSAQSASENNYWVDDAIKASAIVYAGANVLEPAPIYGAAIGLNCYFLRAEFEIGGSWIDPGASFSRKQMLYFSPSFGLAHTFQKKYEVYLMSSWIMGAVRCWKRQTTTIAGMTSLKKTCSTGVSKPEPTLRSAKDCSSM